jgi:hypothetical protein
VRASETEDDSGPEWPVRRSVVSSRNGRAAVHLEALPDFLAVAGLPHRVVYDRVFGECLVDRVEVLPSFGFVANTTAGAHC